MTIQWLLPVTVAGTVFAAAACSPTEEAADGLPAVETAVVDLPDTTGASLWAYLTEMNYARHWDLWPGQGRLYTGREPHGMLLTTYLNDVAREALERGAETMPAGAIVVKENYMPDSTLAAVTVMYKVPGYNPEHADWFFTKHRPSGELDTAPNGMAMEGRLPGCQSCHMGVRANDYLFTSSLSSNGG